MVNTVEKLGWGSAVIDSQFKVSFSATMFCPLLDYLMAEFIVVSVCVSFLYLYLKLNANAEVC